MHKIRRLIQTIADVDGTAAATLESELHRHNAQLTRGEAETIFRATHLGAATSHRALAKRAANALWRLGAWALADDHWQLTDDAGDQWHTSGFVGDSLVLVSARHDVARAVGLGVCRNRLDRHGVEPDTVVACAQEARSAMWRWQTGAESLSILTINDREATLHIGREHRAYRCSRGRVFRILCSIDTEDQMVSVDVEPQTHIVVLTENVGRVLDNNQDVWEDWSTLGTDVKSSLETLAQRYGPRRNRTRSAAMAALGVVAPPTTMWLGGGS